MRTLEGLALATGLLAILFSPLKTSQAIPTKGRIDSLVLANSNPFENTPTKTEVHTPKSLGIPHIEEAINKLGGKKMVRIKESNGPPHYLTTRHSYKLLHKLAGVYCRKAYFVLTEKSYAIQWRDSKDTNVYLTRFLDVVRAADTNNIERGKGEYVGDYIVTDTETNLLVYKAITIITRGRIP